MKILVSTTSDKITEGCLWFQSIAKKYNKVMGNIFFFFFDKAEADNMLLICGSNIEKMLIQERIKLENYVNVNDN